MRYLKIYELFNVSEDSDLVSDIEDICQELKDDNFEAIVEYRSGQWKCQFIKQEIKETYT